MDRSKYFLRHVNLINIILMIVIIFFLYKVLFFVNASVGYTAPPIDRASVSETEAQKEGSEYSVPPHSDYIVIAGQNLFHPDRRALMNRREAAPLHRPDFVLYGTLVTEDVKIAFLDDLKTPYSTPGRGKRQWALSIGDELSGYTLSEVYHDRAVMVSGSDRVELAIADFLRPKVRDAGTTAVRKKESRTIKKHKEEKKIKEKGENWKARIKRKKSKKKDDD